MITLQAARHPRELLDATAAPSAYDYGTLFKGDGWFARRRAAARLKFLKKIEAKLGRVLRPGERVHFATKGSLASLAERFFAGHAVAYHVNLRALVFTNERVILMQIGANSKPRDLVSELSYGSIRSLKSTWAGFCEVRLPNGKQHRFSSMPRADRKFLTEFLAGIIPTPANAAVPANTDDGLVHLCPHCFTGLPGWPRVCGHCGGGIKSATTAALLSFGLPGLGDWYLGHRWFAVFEIIGAALLWLVFVIRPMGELSRDDGVAPDESFWILALCIVGGTHLIDAGVTFNFARKGHHPGRKPLARVS